MSAQELSKGGFTLIEIMLVLAIAALIMVIVFLAVGGAQRSQRDRARQDAVNRFVAAVNAAAGNNNGTMPTPSATAPAGWSSPVKPALSLTTASTNIGLTAGNAEIYWSSTKAGTVNCAGGNSGVATASGGYIETTLENGLALYCVAY